MNKTIKNILLAFGYKAATAGVVFATAIFFSRTLGPDLQGKYSLLVAVTVIIFTLGNLGLGVSANYFPANKKSEIKTYLSNFIVLSVLLAIILSICGIIFRLITKSFFLNNVGDLLFYLMFLTVPIRIVSLVLENFLLGLKRFYFFNIVSFVKILSKFLLGIFIYLYTRDLLLGYVLAYTISHLVTLPWVINSIKKVARYNSKEVSKEISKKILNFGLKNYLNNIFLFLEFKIDLLVVNFFLGATSVGFYSIAVAMSEISNVFSGAINLVLYPKIAETRDREKLEKIKNIGILLSAIFSFCFSLIVYLWAPVFIKTFFGHAYMSAVPALKVMAFVTLFSNVKVVIINNLSAQNLIQISNSVNITTLILNIALNICLVPQFGIVGAAYSSLISYSLSVALLLFKYKAHKKKMSEVANTEASLSPSRDFI